MNAAKPSFICASCSRALRTKPQTVRQFSYTASSQNDAELPRWKQTPPAMKMPIRLRPHAKQPAWHVNTDEAKLDEAIDRFLGNVGGKLRGSELLDKETKWLSITHKSFDHGRRGFNDRLAYLGKRIVDVQTSLALLSAPPSPLTSTSALDPAHVYKHPSLEGLENLSFPNKMAALDKSRLSQIARNHGIDRVVRWKPKKSDNLEGSGENVVLTHTIYSIIGAVAMQRGGEVAAQAVRERILSPLGLRYR